MQIYSLYFFLKFNINLAYLLSKGEKNMKVEESEHESKHWKKGSFVNRSKSTLQLYWFRIIWDIIILGIGAFAAKYILRFERVIGYNFFGILLTKFIYEWLLYKLSVRPAYYRAVYQ